MKGEESFDYSTTLMTLLGISIWGINESFLMDNTYL